MRGEVTRGITGSAELRNILPAADYPLVDLPINHSIFHTLFEAKRIPQIPNIGFFRGSGGQTSEQWEDSRTPHAYALIDANGRIVGADDAQHRLRRRVRARSRRSGVLLQVLRRGLRDRHQRAPLLDDALTVGRWSWFSIVSLRARVARP